MIKNLFCLNWILNLLINYFTGYPNTDEATPILDILDGMKPSNTTGGGTSVLGGLVGKIFKKSFA